MGILLAGLALFLGVHLIPIVPPLRAQLQAWLGENGYRLGFSLVSAVGLALTVVGYARAPTGPEWFMPFPLAIMLAPFVMLASFVLLAAAQLRTHLRRVLGHPMLIGVGLWAGVHLLATGHTRAILLFGAFLAYVAVDLVSASLRGAVKRFTPSPRHDLIAIGAGIAVGLAVMALHRPLFGSPVVAWGL
jgi:uncharacterized membrane protein